MESTERRRSQADHDRHRPQQRKQPENVIVGVRGGTSDSVSSRTFYADAKMSIVGRLVKKRKYPGPYMSLAIKVKQRHQDDGQNWNFGDTINGNSQDDPPMLIFVPKNDPALRWCHVDSWIQVDILDKTSSTDGDVDIGNPRAIQDNTKVDSSDDDDGTANKSTFVNAKHTLTTNLRLVKCAPNPSVIPDLLMGVKQKQVHFGVFSNYCQSLQHEWQIDEILDVPPTNRDRKRLINEICQQLKDDDRILVYGSGVAVRNTHLKKRYLDILHKMESSIALVDVQDGEDDGCQDGRDGHGQDRQEQNTSTTSNVFHGSTRSAEKSDCEETKIYNIPGNDLTLKSFRHPRSRFEYLQDKKWPQINWLLKRMRRFKLFDGSSSSSPISVLDVGGGRGDIACAIAKEFPQTQVTVVDENQASLDAGQQYATEMCLSDQINFVCADFRTYSTEYVQRYRQQQAVDGVKSGAFDFVVAWHACGDLSDISLQFANDIDASYVICPCCYTKERLEGFTPSWIGKYLNGDCDKEFMCREIPKGIGEQGENSSKSVSAESASSSSPTSNLTSKTRRDEIDAIQKLAETNDRPDVSRRAMTVINSMRMHALGIVDGGRDGGTTTNGDDAHENKHTHSPLRLVHLESYPLEYSSKNLVLVKE